MTGDLLRCAIASAALVLCMTSAASMVWSILGWDQRLRFAAMLWLGVVITGGQLDALGRAPTVWTWLLAPGVALAVVSTAAFLFKRAPVVLSGGGDSEDR